MCLGILAAFYKCFFRVLRGLYARLLRILTIVELSAPTPSLVALLAREQRQTNHIESRRAGLGVPAASRLYDSQEALEDLKRSLTRGA